MKIVFMGTPDFAVSSLNALYENGHEIVGVYTQTDKLVGRKQVLTPPPVKVRALELGIPVFQPTTLKDGTVLEDLKKFCPDVIVVVAYGKFLPKEILELPKFGCVNVHGSLLPKLRGASPIQWSIVTGEKTTGITTMLMDQGMDTGDMLESVTVDIDNNDDFRSLHDKLAQAGATLICSTLNKLENGTAVRTKQDDTLATYAPIIKKEMGNIDFKKNATEIRNLVRAFNVWPAAFTFLEGKRLKVLGASVCDISHSSEPGTIIDLTNGICVAAGESTSIMLDYVHLEGSKAMSGTDLLKGHRLQKGMKLGD